MTQYTSPHERKLVCGHRQYMLDCDEFDDLLERAGYQCEICGRTDWMVIDHDHDAGPAAVRGILCGKCNWLVGAVERGAKVTTDEVDTYLAQSWFLTGEAALRVKIYKSSRDVRPADKHWHARALRAEGERDSWRDRALRAEAELKAIKGER